MPRPTEHDRAPGSNRQTTDEGAPKATGTNWKLAVASTFVGVLLLPVLLFVVQSDCVSYYHHARCLLGEAEPHELHFRRTFWYRLPQEERFESRVQREDFLGRLPEKIRTKEALSDWIVACLESRSPSLVEWALYRMEPAEMVRMPQRSRIMSLTRQCANTSDGFNRRMARNRLRENSATRLVLAKWAGLLGIAVAGVIAFKKVRKVSLKKLVIWLGIAQVIVPAAGVFIIAVTASALFGGGDTGGVSGMFVTIQTTKVIFNLCIVCLIIGWAFVMWSLIMRIKGPARSLSLLVGPVLIAVLINVNMLMGFS